MEVLDHAGTTLTSKALMNAFTREMASTIISNPHSAGDRQNKVQDIIDRTRRKVLSLFAASPDCFDVVFVANATAGIKLVLEAFSPHEQGFEYYYHRDAHTSLIGPRELATSSQCFASDEEAENWLSSSDDAMPGRLKLFAYPGQSNMNGRRLPLSWPSKLRSNTSKSNAYSLFDAAALITTGQLDLSDYEAAPDFIVMSFYKVFGFPDLGALIVRKPAGALFDKRRYFGGGTTEMITVFGERTWYARKEKALYSRLEDGTPAIRSILALSCAIDEHTKLYGGAAEISKHTAWLSKCLFDRLVMLRHGNGTPVCEIYKDPASAYGDVKTQGGTVTFNVRDSSRSYVSSTHVGALALDIGILLRAGSLCNPGGMFQALGLQSGDVEKAFASGFRCNKLGSDILGGFAYGMVRASLGPMSTLSDVEKLAQFIDNNFTEDILVKSSDETFVGSQRIAMAAKTKGERTQAGKARGETGEREKRGSGDEASCFSGVTKSLKRFRTRVFAFRGHAQE